MDINQLIKLAIQEDIGDGDHTSLATIPKDAKGKARLLVKEPGILAGIDIAKKVFGMYDSSIEMEVLIEDGKRINKGDIAFFVSGPDISILSAERLVLNYMQRMSGIATYTNQLVEKVAPYKARILDTRKTTPNMRIFEKMAVRIGGGENHRMGLYDMIMIKDNHVDFAGGIGKAIEATHSYLTANDKKLKIEIEVRSFSELEEVMRIGKVDRIMLDNFTPKNMTEAIKIINGQYETEASGGITIDTIEGYAATGVDFISVGALTHHITSLDLSLKALTNK